MRSRAVSLPLACCASMRFWPPPRRAAARFSSSWRMMSCMRHLGDSGVLQSWAMEACPPGRFLASRVAACRGSVSFLVPSRYPSSRWAAAAGVMPPAATARLIVSRSCLTCGCCRKRPRRPLSMSVHIQSTAWRWRFASSSPLSVITLR